MVKKKKAVKKKSGAEATYITRARAIRKLQVSLATFRKLCILRGVYPRHPPNKLKGRDKTYYYTKDISFLQHDPLLGKFREYRAWRKKVTRARGRGDERRFLALQEQRPQYSLDHCVIDRYPTFMDALKDLDDPLKLAHLFSYLPAKGRLRADIVSTCRKLSIEFQSYVVRAQALRKVFVTIKGIYYQADIKGVAVTWLAPHMFTYEIPSDVDLRSMLSFNEFYCSLLGFVNYRLFASLDLQYPPQILDAQEECDFRSGLLDILDGPLRKKTSITTINKGKGKGRQQSSHSAARVQLSGRALKEFEAEEKTRNDGNDDIGDEVEIDDEDGDEDDTNGVDQEVFAQPLSREMKEINNQKNLFKGLKIFLARETPIDSLVFVVRACGGVVGWQGEESPFAMDEADITHHIVDRPLAEDAKTFNRQYLQPQWVYDSVNTCVLLPVAEYSPSAKLPPHLSPFVDDEKEGYVPERRKQLNRLKNELLHGEYDSPSSSRGQNGEELDDNANEEVDQARYEAEIAAEASILRQQKKKRERADVDHEAEEEEQSEEEEADSDDSGEDDMDLGEMLMNKGTKMAKKKAQSAVESQKQRQEEEQKQQKAMLRQMIPGKKKRRLAERIEYGKERKKEKGEVLKEKARLAAERRQSPSTPSTPSKGGKKLKRGKRHSKGDRT